MDMDKGVRVHCPTTRLYWRNTTDMARDSIQAVLFDMGGTLEDLYYDDAVRLEATRELRDLLATCGLDPALSVPDLHAAVLSGLAAYQSWREGCDRELPPEKVWTEYILTDPRLPRDRLLAAADDLAFFYETHYFVRSLRPEAPEALETLRRQGYRLGIISNVISHRLVPNRLSEYGIAGFFDPVVTSVGLGWRKPSVHIFQEAARLLPLPPAACAYVGDTVSRDVVGARRAGYGLSIQIRSFLTAKSDRGTEGVSPDAVIHDLLEVVDLVARAPEVVFGH